MEGPITKHFYFVDPLKQKELIIEFMNLNNFYHPNHPAFSRRAENLSKGPTKAIVC